MIGAIALEFFDPSGFAFPRSFPQQEATRMISSPRDVTGPEKAAMSRALEIATRGPEWGINPRVGCVMLDSHGTTVAEGWHQGSGTSHAEIMALDVLRQRGMTARGLTAVVTLEPCAHTGKNRPLRSGACPSGNCKSCLLGS